MLLYGRQARAIVPPHQIAVLAHAGEQLLRRRRPSNASDRGRVGGSWSCDAKSGIVSATSGKRNEAKRGRERAREGARGRTLRRQRVGEGGAGEREGMRERGGEGARARAGERAGVRIEYGEEERIR